MFDTGIERFMMFMTNSEAMEKGGIKSAMELWKQSVLLCAASYYSNNSGIAALLAYIRGSQLAKTESETYSYKFACVI